MKMRVEGGGGGKRKGSCAESKDSMPEVVFFN